MKLVPLPPTVDEAIRLVRRQHGTISVSGLADAVIARGWKVDRAELIARIREIFPPRGSAQPPAPLPGQSTAPSKNSTGKARRATPGLKGKKKRPKSKSTQDYCPKCHAFVVMTRFEGVTTIARHLTKKGERCLMSERSYKPKPKVRRDAMEFRAPGSFGTGKRR